MSLLAITGIENGCDHDVDELGRKASRNFVGIPIEMSFILRTDLASASFGLMPCVFYKAT